MQQIVKLVKRNVKVYFSDKETFFTSLITPLILLVLYGTFLGKVFKDSYIAAIPNISEEAEKIVSGIVSAQFLASIISVSCVTIAFCSGMVMVKDKMSGARMDLSISPIAKHKLAIAYFIANFISAFIVCMFACVLCFGYSAIVGWYYSIADVFLILSDVVLLTLFGTLLVSVVNVFLSSQGQVTAISTIVSSGYGFISGAYMPISSFAEGLRNVLMFFPSTYFTTLIKNHAMRGGFEALSDSGVHEKAVEGMMKYNDVTIEFFDMVVSQGAIYAVVIGTIFVLLGAYLFLNFLRKERQ